MLTYEGFRYDPDAPVVVLLDVPPGFALSTIEALPLPRQRLIVVTTSPCAEYWEDLWDLHPQALLVSRLLELSTVIRRVLCGEQYRSVPAVAPRLTPTERRTLRLIARGWPSRRIATQLHLQYQTVLNISRSIYKKLGCANRNEAALYYWGTWYMSEQRSDVAEEKIPG